MKKDEKLHKKVKKLVPVGVAYISASFNNTIITITDLNGNTLCWSSGGSAGYKGTKKGTPYVASQAVKSLVHKASRYGLKELIVRIKGPGPGRESAVRALQTAGFTIKSIEDITPLPHNGCRPRKRRRV